VLAPRSSTVERELGEPGLAGAGKVAAIAAEQGPELTNSQQQQQQQQQLSHRTEEA
jgi:hypothetical protein